MSSKILKENQKILKDFLIVVKKQRAPCGALWYERKSRADLDFRVVVVLVCRVLALAVVAEPHIADAVFHAADALKDALVLAVKPSLEIIDALRVGAHTILKAGLEVRVAEVEAEEGKADEGHGVEVEVHVSIVPCGWGLSSKKQKKFLIVVTSDLNIGRCYNYETKEKLLEMPRLWS